MDKAIINVLQNMYNNNSISKENTMAIFKTLENDFTIELIREDVSKLFNIESEYKYKCIFIFKNNIGQEIMRLVLSEIDIFKFLDNLNAYMQNWQLMDIVLSPSIKNNIDCNITNSITIYQEYNSTYQSNPLSYFIVKEFNALYNTTIDRLKIKFNDEKLYEFANLLYFIFLIDIEEENQLKQLYTEHNIDGLLM